MRYLFFIITAAFLFLVCNELNNPYDINSEAGKINQETTPQDTAQPGNATISVVFDTAQGRTLVILTFDSTHRDTLVDSLARQTFVDTLQYIDSIQITDTTIIQETSYDTILFQDTVTLTRYDTTHVSRSDTTWITKYDTTLISKFDTTHVFHYDTSHISQYDTTHVTAYDTAHVTLYDTTHVTRYDTTHFIHYDTIPVATKPHLSFLGNISTGCCWSVPSVDTLFATPCTVFTNDYRYGSCVPRFSCDPTKSYTQPAYAQDFFFKFKFSCPSADSLQYIFVVDNAFSNSCDTLTLLSSHFYNVEISEQGFFVPAGVSQFKFTARSVKPYISQWADWRIFSVVVRNGPGPGGSPGTAQ